MLLNHWQKKKKNYDKPNLLYNTTSCYGYSDDKKFDTFYFKPKYLCLSLFYADLEKFSEIKSGNLKKRREKVHDIISDLYSD